jgi:hypothetical protein
MPAASEWRPVLTEGDPHLPTSGSSPEFELLLACCAQAHDDCRNDRIERLLGQGYHWKNFISLVEHHRVVPHVYRRLASYSFKLPAGEFAALQSIYKQNARKALWFTSELVRIVQHLESQGIRAIPYKGPALAQALYGDVTARQFGDLDILVSPEDVREARCALARLGYKPTIQLSAPLEREYIAAGYEYSFDGESGRHLLELQWRILPRFYSVDCDFAGFLEKAEKIDLGGHSFNTLGAEDLVLVLCLHAAKHVWVQLSWLCDLAELATSPQVDWNATWQRARELGVRRIVAINFLLAHELLGSPLPGPTQRWLADDGISEALKRETMQIIRSMSRHDTESIAYFRLMTQLRERWPDRMRLSWRLFWTPNLGEWSAVRLPEKLFPLYRVLRLFRLASRCVT